MTAAGANPAPGGRVISGMDTTTLIDKFARIGARLKVAGTRPNPWRTPAPFALDVRSDRRGEFFEIARRAGTDVEAEPLDVRPAERHLLLMIREGREKSKLLCGHDERHWFVAGIPEAAPVGTVRQAMESLKPPEVRAAVTAKRLRADEGNRRKNAAFVRQGEWFFLPDPAAPVDERLVLHNEPLRRSTGGKPHWVEFCYRYGGEAVHVCQKYPGGVTGGQHKAILAGNPAAALWGWRVMRRNPGVYVKGRVRHADHATITLHGWHRILMNTEGQSKAMRNVAFLD